MHLKGFLFFCLTMISSSLRAESASIRLHGSEESSWSARLGSIRQAEQRLHIEVFYLEDDLIGHELISEIVDAKRKKPRLDVQVLLDAWGSETFPRDLACALKESGIDVKIFSPPVAFKKITQERTHRKIWISDHTAIIGGRNISEEHFSTEGSSHDVPLTDWDVEVHGPIVEKISSSFDQAWSSKKSSEIFCDSEFDNAKILASRKRIGTISSAIMPTWHSANVEWFADVPGERSKSRPVSQKVVSLIQKAQSQILAETFVFIPVSDLAKEMEQAANRNVQIEFLMNGPMVGHWMGELSSCMSLPEINYWLQRKAHIAVTSPRARTHSKAFLVDNKILGIGSFNWDARSYLWNAETLLVIQDSPDIIEEFKAVHLERMQNGNKVKSLEDVFKASEMNSNQEQKCRAQSLLRNVFGRFL